MRVSGDLPEFLWELLRNCRFPLTKITCLGMSSCQARPPWALLNFLIDPAMFMLKPNNTLSWPFETVLPADPHRLALQLA